MGDVTIGKGRGFGVSGPGKSGSFATPPSGAEMLGGGAMGDGPKTQGCMPTEVARSLGPRTMGPVPPSAASGLASGVAGVPTTGSSGVDGVSTNSSSGVARVPTNTATGAENGGSTQFHAAAQSPEDVSGIQRALERELVDHLRQQNARLLEELDALRSAQQQQSTGNGSSLSSWSEVRAVDPQCSASYGVETSHTGPVDGHGKRECRTPRAHDQPARKEPRFTPNGTRVPDTPPELGDHQAQSSLPPVPPMPPMPPVSSAVTGDGSFQQFLDQYEAKHFSQKAMRSDSGWVPTSEMSPRRARAFWLEQELKSLKGPEWSQLYTQAGSNSAGLSACAGIPEQPPRGRAEQRGADALHDRAFRHGGEVDGDRASLHLHGAVGSLHGVHGEHRLHDRASHLQDAYRQDVRASHLHDAAHGDNRAWHCHDADRRDDRASQLHDVIQRGTRAYEQWGSCQDHYGGGLHHCRDPGSCPLPGHGSGSRSGPAVGGHESSYGPQMTGWSEGSGGTKAELPELPADSAPLQLGDWLEMCGPIMRDLSAVSARWWFLTMKEADTYYKNWRESTPLQRVQITPRLPDELMDPRYQRTEQRGVNLLMKALPSDQVQVLVTGRELNSTSVLYRLLIRYQPGGSGEKAILLSKLTELESVSSVTGLASSLRTWRRHYDRAAEIQAILPDGSLLLKALEPAVSYIASMDTQAAFRLAQSRSLLQVDEKPTQDAVWRFSQCLLAEAETLSLTTAAVSTTPTTPLKVKQLDATPSPSGPPGGNGKGKGVPQSETPCKWFKSDTGCRAGRSCKWSHSWDNIPDKNARCWVCGSKEHRKNDCKLKGSNGSTRSKGDETKVSGGGGAGGAAGKHAAKSGSTSTPSATPPSKPTLNEMTSSTTTTGAPESESGGGTVKEGASTQSTPAPAKDDSTKSSSAELLQEATQLLKALRSPGGQPRVNVVQLAKLDHVEPIGCWSTQVPLMLCVQRGLKRNGVLPLRPRSCWHRDLQASSG